MCELCAANERHMLGATLQPFLAPGIRIAVKYAMSDTDTEEIFLIDDNNKTAVTLSTSGYICWEAENHGNVEQIADHPREPVVAPTEDETQGNVVKFPG